MLDEIKAYLELLIYSGLYSIDMENIENLKELSEKSKNNSYTYLGTLTLELYKNLKKQNLSIDKNFEKSIEIISKINTYLNIVENKKILDKYLV